MCAVHGLINSRWFALEVGVTFDFRAHGPPVELEILHGDGTLRIPDPTSVTSRGPAARGNCEAPAELSGRPIFISNWKASPCVQQPEGLDARSCFDPHHTGGEAVANQEGAASACRCPKSLPSCRRNCRAGWTPRHRHPWLATSIQPSAPMPVWRWQMARAMAARSPSGAPPPR